MQKDLCLFNQQQYVKEIAYFDLILVFFRGKGINNIV